MPREGYHIWQGLQEENDKQTERSLTTALRKMGLKQVGEYPDFLYYALEEGFIYRPAEVKQNEYIPQQEDKGRAVIIYGPSFCPFSYGLLKRAAQAIKEIVPGISIEWIDRSEEPEEVESSGNVERCLVNAQLMRSLAIDEPNFQKEVMGALESS